MPAANAAADDDVLLLNRAMPGCSTAIASFLTASTPEAQNQFVLEPMATAARMARFVSLSPLTNLDGEELSLVSRSILKLPRGMAIETSWNTSGGKQLDAVFRKENGEWRLDWDHFARYSDYSWSLFLAGSGPPEGEFRLLARERLAEQRKGARAISVVFYAPRFAQPSEPGFESPEFLVLRNTPAGQRLDAGFALARSGAQVFGSKLPNLNPEGMIRVRVKVRRVETDETQRKFEVTAVLACHWYSEDNPGVEPLLPTNPTAEATPPPR